jgi:hypothetical protein
VSGKNSLHDAYPSSGPVGSLVRMVTAHPAGTTTSKTYTVLLTGDGMTDLLFRALYATPLIPAGVHRRSFPVIDGRRGGALCTSSTARRYSSGAAAAEGAAPFARVRAHLLAAVLPLHTA